MRMRWVTGGGEGERTSFSLLPPIDVHAVYPYLSFFPCPFSFLPFLPPLLPFILPPFTLPLCIHPFTLFTHSLTRQPDNGMASIRPLAADVADELRASLVVHSLEQCALELVQNSMYAC